MLADGVVGDAGANFFADYVRKFAGYEPVWPFTDILARVERIFTDGHCNDDEREELKTVMEALCGHVEQAKPEETYSATLPLDSPLPNPILFPERNFVVTGRFAYGTRRKVSDVISALGGIPTDSAPTHQTYYLNWETSAPPEIVAVQVSVDGGSSWTTMKDYAHTAFGAAAAFATDSINLNAFIGQAELHGQLDVAG